MSAQPSSKAALKLRSLLFVPADSERKLAKSTGSAADVLILDLEDAVAEARKPVARTMAAEYIAAQHATMAPKLFVRINPQGRDAVRSSPPRRCTSCSAAATATRW